jgi:outer membrane biosynthesis protein TonB
VRAAQRRRVRRRTWWALLASFLVHLLAIVVVAWFYAAQVLPPPPEVEEIEITIIEPPSSARPETMFVDTSAPESAPPEEVMFESDRDTAAASPLPAEGAEPLPTQEGREEEFLEFEQQELALAEPDPAPPAPELPPSEPAPPEPPKPEMAEQRPTEEETVESPEEEALLAMVDPQPEKQDEEQTPPPPAPPPSRPSYQRQARPTRLRGGVDSQGKATPASLATPLGRYRKQITDAIGSSWYHHIGPRMDMFGFGTATVLFEIGPDGKARKPKVLRNSSNESFEIMTLQSILAADIPPIPPDILPTLEGGRIEIEFSFSIISH